MQYRPILFAKRKYFCSIFVIQNMTRAYALLLLSRIDQEFHGAALRSQGLEVLDVLQKPRAERLRRFNLYWDQAIANTK